MTIASLFRKWNDFFFEPAPPTPLVLYRILYGIMNLFNILLMVPDWTAYFGPHAIVTLATVLRTHHGLRPDIFVWLPQTDFVTNVFFWVFTLLCVFVIVGFMTRTSL